MFCNLGRDSDAVKLPIAYLLSISNSAVTLLDESCSWAGKTVLLALSRPTPTVAPGLL
jgi:hypothetical protein